MATIQAESILANGGIDGADLFERFRVWANDANDVGIQTRAVLRSGKPWDVAATEHFERNPRSGAGNGSLMRSTPTAVHFARSSVDETIAAARATSIAIHGDPAAGWGTALFHLMIRAALAGDDPFAALADGLAMLPDDQDRYQRMLDPDWTPASPEVPNGTVWGCLATTARTYRTPDLQELTQRLLGSTPYPMAELGAPVGPTEIAPGLYAADLAAASTVPTDWAVVSLCRVGDRFRDHPIRREVFLSDGDGDAGLELVVEDTVATIDAFLTAGHNVVVHCHHGASRTGLALRAWLMRTNGWDEPTATEHLANIWPRLNLWNTTFTKTLLNWK
jgi:ADP-ribosyl-[dinitrogen reductase] hydrolase